MLSFLLSLVPFVAISSINALGLNLQWGYTGIVNFGQVAFMAVGAYITALLTLQGLPVPLGILAGTVGAALCAYPLGWATTRLKEDYLAIVTIGFAEVVQVFLTNLHATGGPNGLPGIPALVNLTGAAGPWLVAGVLGAVVAAVWWAFDRLASSPYGRVLWAIQENEAGAKALGKPVVRFKTTSLVLGTAAAGLAGALYAHVLSYVVPDQFSSTVTFYLWAGIILGGNRNLGTILGTVFIVVVTQATQFLNQATLPIDASAVANMRFMLVGVVMVAVLFLRPDGLLTYVHPSQRKDDPHADG